MGKLNSRQLTRKVLLQRKSLTRDEWGQPLDNWTTYATVRAAPRVQTGMGYVNQEMQTAATEVSRTIVSYRVRKRTNVIAADRLLDGVAIYDIRVVLPDLEDNNYVDLGCATGAVANGTNSAPVITSNGGGSTASISIPEGTTAVTTVVATDADGVLTYSISSGSDAALFTINSSTGVLRFVSAPDYEIRLDADSDNVYEVTVKATDLFGSTDAQAISVTVTAVNDTVPAITSNGGGATASISVEEAQTAVTTVMSTDADGPTPAYTIVGGADAALFAINSGSGVLTFVDAPAYDYPADADVNNVYEVTVQVSDGVNTDTQAISVTVTEVVSIDSAFQWDAPASGDAPTGYRLYWGTATGDYTFGPHEDASFDLSEDYVDLGLAADTTYYVIARAYNASGEGPDSNEIEVLNGVQIGP
jgi:SPP1 family predicted phage head-tail adaptor